MFRFAESSGKALHAEDVVPTVDVDDFSGDSPGQGAGQEEGGVADFADFGRFAKGGALGVEFDHTKDTRHRR